MHFLYKGIDSCLPDNYFSLISPNESSTISYLKLSALPRNSDSCFYDDSTLTPNKKLEVSNAHRHSASISMPGNTAELQYKFDKLGAPKVVITH